MKKSGIIFTLYLVSLICYSQDDVRFYLHQIDENTLSFESPFCMKFFDIENFSQYTLRKNPAFVHFQNKREDSISDLPTIRYKRILAGSFFSCNVNGEYLFHQGKRLAEASLFAAGEQSIANLGTFLGSVSYVSKRHTHALLNYATNPEDYFPYIVSDTLGQGTVSFEDYAIKGGFGFTHKNTHYGIGASYNGVISARLTDPRFSTYTSWLRFDMGIVSRWQHNVYSLRLFPEFNRQNISVKDFRGLGTKYFQFYGFGAWNRKESSAGYNYQRLMTLKGVGLDFAYKRLPVNKKSPDFTVRFLYNFREMNTHEGTNKNLFSTNTHRFKSDVSFAKNRQNLTFYVLFVGDNRIRSGTEYIYENRKVEEENNLYDYVKVASSKMYHQKIYSNTIFLKTVYNISKQQSVHFQGGLNYYHYQERYVLPKKKNKNRTITPIAGIGYRGVFRKNQLTCTLSYLHTKSLENVFKIPDVRSKIVLQQAYIPSLINGAENNALLSELIYAYSLKNKRAIGIQCAFYYKKRTKIPASLSAIAKPQDREQSACNIKLFYLF